MNSRSSLWFMKTFSVTRKIFAGNRHRNVNNVIQDTTPPMSNNSHPSTFSFVRGTVYEINMRSKKKFSFINHNTNRDIADKQPNGGSGMNWPLGSPLERQEQPKPLLDLTQNSGSAEYADIYF